MPTQIYKCKLCDGTGTYRNEMCSACDGRGQVVYNECIHCFGTGRVEPLGPFPWNRVNERCPHCKGKGYIRMI